MSAIRRALGRKEVLLGLAIFLLAGGWFGWRHVLRPAFGQASVSTTDLAQVLSLMDAGRYAEAIAQADALPAAPAVLKYKAIAQMFAGQPAAALQTVEIGLSGGATGPDAAGLLAVRALVLLAHEYQQVPQASQAAALALELSGQEPEAQELARVALGAALRSQLDATSDAQTILAGAGQIRQVLTPLMQQVPACPTSDWQSKLWRRGLAVLADAGSLAAQAGDAGAELDAMALLQQHCPQDAWACYLGIPERALQAAMQPAAPGSVVDDHARIAMYTAVGYLYTQVGDRAHCDSLLRKVIHVYERLLEDYDRWDGQKGLTVTPQGKFKSVGAEFYTYRNRVERLAMYSADWWARRTLNGDVAIGDALTACDQRLFRALVRLRVDKDTNPIEILHQERIRPVDYLTVGYKLRDWAAPPQADPERERAQLVLKVGEELCGIENAQRDAQPLLMARKFQEAAVLFAQALDPPPTSALVRVRMRMLLGEALFHARQFAEVVTVMDAVLEDVRTGDAYLGNLAQPSILRQAYAWKAQALLYSQQLPEATTMAESLANDPDQPAEVRLQMLRELVQFYSVAHRPELAAAALEQLGSLEVPDEHAESLRQILLKSVRHEIANAAVHPPQD